MFRNFPLISLLLCLSSCAFFQSDPVADRNARCKELANRMVFNGATSDPAAAAEQRAEMGNLNRSYRQENCNN